MVGIRKIETTTYLTPEMAHAVASVATCWANLELEMEHVIRLLSKTPYRVTRVLVIGMNARTRLGCIEGLYQLRKSGNRTMLDEFKTIKEEIEKGAEGTRNKVVHGVWHRNKKGQYSLVRTSGTWQPPGKPWKVKRAVHPELEPMDAPKVRAIQWQLNDLLTRLRVWHAKL